ncbi:chemotaxis protein CheC [Lachnospiraceae bacterium ZAX-1]
MAIENLAQLNAEQLDVLTEVGNIGSGHAATALATMLNTVVDIEIPNITLVDLDKVYQFLGDKDDLAIGLTLDVTGDLSGMILQVVQKDFFNKLTNTFFGQERDSLDSISEMDFSLVHEVGNITSGAYVNALANMVKMMINIGPPAHHVGTLEAILNLPLGEKPHLNPQVLYIDEKLQISNSEVRCSMIFILELPSLLKLFDKLKVQY